MKRLAAALVGPALIAVGCGAAHHNEASDIVHAIRAPLAAFINRESRALCHFVPGRYRYGDSNPGFRHERAAS